MDFDLAQPIASPPIVRLVLTKSTYRFADNVIVIDWDGFGADGALLRQGQDTLNADEVQAYFDTPLQEAGFRATFVAAFVIAVQRKHGAATVGA